MANSRPGQGSTPQSRGVGDIVKDIQGEIRTIVKGEIDLAKSELVPSAKNAGVGAGAFTGALYFMLNALLLLYVAGALAIWQWLDIPIALGFVIMAGVLIVIAAILGLFGLGRVKKVKGPDRAIAQGQQTADAVKTAIARGNAAATAQQIEARPEPARAVTADRSRR
jgi:hypothetical protein